MKEALVSPDSSVKIVDSPIPTPGKGDILIKVVYAGTNPKDWKFPSVSNTTLNSGDDVAGIVEQFGEGVLEFRPGDRVAAFHRLAEIGGAFAEYAIAPATTTFHLPENISFEEVCRSSIYRESEHMLIRNHTGCHYPFDSVHCGSRAVPQP
jgi:NADPH2:quinone reductase